MRVVYYHTYGIYICRYDLDFFSQNQKITVISKFPITTEIVFMNLSR